jgi:hypothetical protein
VFEEVSLLVQTALIGSSPIIIAHGRSGSGKTYTIEGETGERRGILPRAAELLFESCPDAVISLKITELYFEDPKPRVLVCSELKCMDDFEAKFEEAKSHRRTAATKLNQQSSRSHMLVELQIRGKGKITFVDLAGSEGGDVAPGDCSAKELKRIKKEGDFIRQTLGDLQELIKKLRERRKIMPSDVTQSKRLNHLLWPSLKDSDVRGKLLLFLHLKREDVSTLSGFFKSFTPKVDSAWKFRRQG